LLFACLIVCGFATVSYAAEPPAGYGEGATWCAQAVPDGYNLGFGFDNVYACGPANNNGAGYEVPASGAYAGFFEDSDYEFQCTELANRFLYDVWRIAPVSGTNLDGDDFASTVANERSAKLVHNGTAGEPYLPGDIVSFSGKPGDGEPDGHVGIVTASTENSIGNGSVMIMEENSPTGRDGDETLTVSNWSLATPTSSYVTPSDFDALASSSPEPSSPAPPECTLALAKRLTARSSTPVALRKEVSLYTPYFGGITDVTCVSVTDGESDLEFDVASGGSAGFAAWVVFRHPASGWTLAGWNPGPGRIPIGFLDGNVVVTVGVYEPGNPFCCPTGGYNHHEYHWNGASFVTTQSWHSTTASLTRR